MSERGWNTREVALGGVRYPYHYGFDWAGDIARQLGRMRTDRFLVVTDDTVLKTHGQALLPGLAEHAPVTELSLPPGEDIKTLRSLSAHLERAIESGATRRSIVVAFGGGVPGNLGGLLAGLLFRGVRLVHVPTTTVAAMDSTISLKQAVNSGNGKNHFGMYHAPEGVFADVKFLQTLPSRELRSGLSEMAKNCLAIRPTALPALRNVLAGGAWNSAEALLWLLDESLSAKTGVTLADAKEQGSGLVLEYGHTVGHAVEICDHRLRGHAAISHGEAVALGMRAAARVAAALGHLDAAAVGVHDEVVAALGGPQRVPPGSSLDDIMGVIRADNKRGYLALGEHEVAMVLLRALGEPLGTPQRPLVPVDLAVVRDAVAALM